MVESTIAPQAEGALPKKYYSLSPLGTGNKTHHSSTRLGITFDFAQDQFDFIISVHYVPEIIVSLI